MDESMLRNLSQELQNLLVEIQSEKITNRYKSTERLNTVLLNQKYEIITILREKNKFNVNWSDFYTSVMDSIVKHSIKLGESQNSKSFQTMENKNYTYFAILTKIIDYGTEAKISFPTEIILERFFSSFNSNHILRYFGSALLQVLENTVVNNKSNFSTITIKDFSRLLAYLFNSLENSVNLSMVDLLLKNINKTIELGSNYLQISYYLLEFIPNLKDLCKPTKCDLYEERHKNQIIKMVYLFSKNLSIDFHKSACDLTRNVLSQILTFYEIRMRDENKEILWDLCNLSVIIHYSSIYSRSNSSTLTIHNLEESNDSGSDWNKILRQMFSIVKNEISRKYSTGKIENFIVSEKFLKLSSSLSYLVYWKNILRDSVPENPKIKVKKTSEKIDAIIDFIQDISGILNWIWFNVLSELLLNYPITLDQIEYSQIINLTSYSLNQIKHHHQLHILMKCSKALLLHGNNLIERNLIADLFEVDEKFWNKIWNLAASDSSVQDEKFIYEKHKLLQILLKNRKILRRSATTPTTSTTTTPTTSLVPTPSSSLSSFSSPSSSSIIMTPNSINLIIQTIISKPIKTRIILETIKTVLLFHGDTLMKSSMNLVQSIITWLHSNDQKILSTANLNLNAMEEENLELISEISVLLVTKIMVKPEENSTTIHTEDRKGNTHDAENDEFENEIVRHLHYKYLHKLVYFDAQKDKVDFKDGNTSIKQSQAPAVAFNETNLEILLKAMKLDLVNNLENNPETAMSSTHANDIFIQNVMKLEKATVLMHKFIEINGSSNCEKHLMPLMKKITFLLNTADMEVQKIKTNEYNLEELKMIIQRFKIIFEILNQYKNLNLIMEIDLFHIVSFVGRLTEKEELMKHFDDYQDIRNLIHNSLKTLAICNCNEMSRINMEVFEQLRKYYELNTIKNEIDAEIFFEIIKVYYTHKSNEIIAEWIMGELTEICEKHHSNKNISEMVVSHLPGILDYIKDHENLVEYINIITSSFLKKCYKNMCSIPFTCKLISSLRNFIRIYPNFLKNKNFFKICESLNRFIVSKSLQIQLNFIEIFNYLINSDWSFHDKIIPEDHYEFCNRMYVNLEGILEKADCSGEISSNFICVKIQLWITISMVSPCLRELSFLDLAKFCIGNQNLVKILNTHKIFDNLFSIVSENIVELVISSLLLSACPFESLPWYLFNSEEKHFYKEHHAILLFCMWQSLKGDLYDLKSRIGNGIEVNEIVKAGIPICHAYMLPHLVGIKMDNAIYKTFYQSIHNSIVAYDKSFLQASIQDNLWNTIYHLFNYVWDDNEFQEFFGFGMIYRDGRSLSIDYATAKSCLQHLLSSILSFKTLLKEESIHIIKAIAVFKLQYEKSTQTENKLIQMFRYCCIVELIIESLCYEFYKGDQKKIANFFIKDVVYFFGNVLTNTKDSISVKLASLFYLRKFFKAILSTHSDTLGQCLRPLVRQIVYLIENSLNQDILSSCFETLNFLLCDSLNNLGEFIYELDDFPNTKEFSVFIDARKKLKPIGEVSDGDHLKNNLESFVKHSDRNKEKLRNLSENISKKKSELKQLCQVIPLNCEENLIHQTIVDLLEIIRSNENSVIIMEASRCLGEIGPVDLRTIALNNNNSANAIIYKIQSATSIEKYIDRFVQCAAKSLKNLIFSHSQEVCALANDVCHIIANSNINFDFMNDHEFLYPFKTKQFHSKETITIGFLENLDFMKILNNSDKYSYNNWIKYFISNFYNFFGWYSLEKLASIEISFCEATLIPLIKIFIRLPNSNLIKQFESMINYFFEATSKAIVEKCNLKSPNIYSDKSVIQVFLNIVECIRLYKQFLNKPFDINFLHVAEACVYCEAYFMAILYLELWALHMQDVSNNTKEELIANEIFQNVAKESYKSIGILDAIEAFLNPISSRFEYLSNQNKWTEILLELDPLNNSSSSNLQLKHMKGNGLFSLTSKFQTEENDIDYEICWRLAQWDKPDDNDLEKYNNSIVSDSCLEFHHFQALKSINKKNKELVIDSIEKGRKCIIEILRNISTECTQTVYKYALWLQLFQQIEDFHEIQFSTNVTADQLLEKWDEQDGITFGNCAHKEITISQKLCLIQSGGVKAERRIKECDRGQDIIGNYMLKAIKACIEADKQNLATRYISNLRQMEVSDDVKMNAWLEDAKMNWNSSNTVLAKSILHHLVTKQEFMTCTNKVDALRIYGELLAETNSEGFDVLHEKFFKLSLGLVDKFSNHREFLLKSKPKARNLLEFDKFSTKCRKENYFSIAKYADREYVQLTSYMNSNAFKTKLKLIQVNKDTVKQEKENKIQDRDKLITLNILMKNSGIDDNEVKITEAKRTEYLCLAVRNYINCCVLEGTIKTTTLYRVLGLWFSNKTNAELMTEIENLIYQIPNYKFICVLDQIIARLGNSNVRFMDVMKNILLKCTREHPHHTLPKLLALTNANADGNKKSLPNDNRCLAVKQILKQIKTEEYAYKCMAQLQQVFTALIEFSNKELSDKEKKAKITTFNISADLQKLTNLQFVHCLTVELPISPNQDYSNIKSIYKWEKTVSLVGGINAPKKLNCLCSDGITRTQLLKGKDDLRQDAIMMQALQIVNDLFNANKRENLNIRTYKVVPLSKRSGILEWCENTIPLGMYLVGPDKQHGAHKKYRPEDYTAAKCRQLMNQKLQSSYEDKLKTYLDICKCIKPVLHHFFFENFSTPGIWFQRRLSYINSVATTSMVGYVLGLGDRHVQNILIDKKTAELIHIDFGIAFEQGKIMPTPETIPFRLTRDIVAPMGVCETDGVFSKCCEQVMTILRKNQSVLMTILEVLLYDPLYSWILNSKKIMKIQNVKLDMTSDELEEKNSTAERALLRVKSKLDGMDEAGIGITNVEVQVQRLINQAMNPKNLCRLFPGWEPYL